MAKYYSANDKIQKFYEEHGDFVEGPDNIRIFEDGSELENSSSGMGMMLPGSELEELDRAQNIAQYCEIKATQAAEAFESLRDFLNGDGCCDADVAHASPDEQLAHLKKLKKKATAARMKLRQALAAVEQEEPFWVKHKQQIDLDQQRKRELFRRKINRIKI